MSPIRIYFASDLHGSTLCWKKFLASADFYKAQVIIVGGDITGKFLIPAIRAGGKWTVEFQGIRRKLETEDELGSMRGYVEDTGSYLLEVGVDEVGQIQADNGRLTAVFEELVLERIEKWVEMADAKLAGTDVQCFVSAGNDDVYEVDTLLAKSAVIQDPNKRVVEIRGGLYLLGLGLGNQTPWDCPRDVSEAALAEELDRLGEEMVNPERTIFDIHVPPFDSGLDRAPQLDDELQVQTIGAGEPAMVPVGSTAVRAAIEHWSPVLGLHGHIHESRAQRMLGRTVIVNPGSQYQDGVLNGAIVDIDPIDGVHKVQLVSG